MVLPLIRNLDGETRNLFESVGEAARLFSAEHSVAPCYITVSGANFALIRRVHESRPGTGEVVRCLQLVAEVDNRLDNETFRLDGPDKEKSGWYKNPIETWT
jgi:hypothetical protein